MKTASRDSNSQSRPVPSQALASLLQRSGDIERQVKRFLSARMDQQKLRWRSALTAAAAGVAGMLVAVAALLMGVWCLVQGLAGAVSTLAPGHPWIGDVAAGLLVVGAILGGAAALWRIWISVSMRKAMAKYDRGIPAAASPAVETKSNHVPPHFKKGQSRS